MAMKNRERCSIANVTQHFAAGDIDGYTPLPLGNGDIGGLFDAFGGTFYDELRCGTGAERDIRTLLLTRLVAIDYQCIDGRDTAWHNFDLSWMVPADTPEHYFAPTAPFTLRIGPPDVDFFERVEDHRQHLNLPDATLHTNYSYENGTVSLESWVHPQQSLLVYRVQSSAELVFAFEEAPTPERRLPFSIDDTNPDHARARKGYFEPRIEDNLLLVETMTNIQCPGHFAVAASGGQWREATLHLPPGEHTVYIAVGHQSLTEPRQRLERVRNQARDALAKGYAALRRQHVRWWREFWGRSYVELPDKRIEAMWFRSQYYLACFLPRRVPAINLEGAYSVFPAFAGGHIQDTAFHLFGAISSGHPELCEGTLRCLLEGLPVAEATARHAYFARGARYPWQQATLGMLPYLEGHRNAPFAEHHQNACVIEAIRRFLESYGSPQRETRKLYPIVRSVARFWSSILNPRDEWFEIRYVPALSQNEDLDSLNRPNIIDILLSAKWSLQVAAEMGTALKLDKAEAARWHDESERIGLHFTRLPDGSYGIHEHHTDIDGKAPAQLLGMLVAPILQEYDPTGLQKTFDRLRQSIDYRLCGFTPAYYSIAAARMHDAQMVGECLQEMFVFSKEPWIMFRENAPQGRMPYFLAGHALFVQGINEMLIQNTSGQPELFPACPFEEAEFCLPSGNRMFTARKRGEHIEVLNQESTKYRSFPL